jgi:hypothetical protein
MATAILALGLHAQAEAAPILQFQFAQGATTITSAAFAASVWSLNGVVIGDYTVSVTGAWMNGTAGAGGSNLQATQINVRRQTSSSADPLEVFITAVGYDLPVASSYFLGTTLAATKSGTSASVAIPVDSQGYIDFLNTPFGLQNTNGQIGCSPSGAGQLQSCSIDGTDVSFAPGGIPFSMTTRTVFNIGQSDTLSVLGTTSQVLTMNAPTSVPEPATGALLGMGLLGLTALCRRSKK